ncbi:chymotrypsin elastase family member 2a [Plakobranchus ocellatus]|uniref:Chymotrypsin elastase family member 2a n=1 Tax=Plakobranchus ocellatus TaxID=259542 RepID=A0AAV4A954_9GAST|nr:chymotrypsin elastase family member 2a [Plakobranchus ocellatus]
MFFIYSRPLNLPENRDKIIFTKVFGVALWVYHLTNLIDKVVTQECEEYGTFLSPFTIKAYLSQYEEWRKLMQIISQKRIWPRPYRDLYFPVTPLGKPSCGTTDTDFESIVSGQVAPKRAWPWFAYVTGYFKVGKTNFRSTCGGALISNQWVLTVKHCLKPKMEVRLGSVRVSGKQDRFVVRKLVQKQFEHKDWDFALLKLSTPVIYSRSIRPVCLPDGTMDITSPHLDCFIVGFGRTQPRRRSTAKSLQQLKVCRQSPRCSYKIVCSLCRGLELELLVTPQLSQTVFEKLDSYGARTYKK